jgi:hypothetical protein
VAETNGLLNRRTGKSGTEGSNPSVSAILVLPCRLPATRPGGTVKCHDKRLAGVPKRPICSHLPFRKSLVAMV